MRTKEQEAPELLPPFNSPSSCGTETPINGRFSLYLSPIKGNQAADVRDCEPGGHPDCTPAGCPALLPPDAPHDGIVPSMTRPTCPPIQHPGGGWAGSLSGRHCPPDTRSYFDGHTCCQRERKGAAAAVAAAVLGWWG